MSELAFYLALVRRARNRAQGLDGFACLDEQIRKIAADIIGA